MEANETSLTLKQVPRDVPRFAPTKPHESEGRMGLLNFWKKTPKFVAVNALEKMIADGKLATDPRGFFELFMTRDIYLATPVPKETGFKTSQTGETIQLETADIDGHRVAFAFTSEEALTFASKATARGYVKLAGRAALEMLLDAKLTMNLNGGLGAPILVGPDQIKFIFQALSQAPAGGEQVVVEAGTEIKYAVPEASENVLRAISDFLKNRPQFCEVGLTYMVQGKQPPGLLVFLTQEGAPNHDQDAVQALFNLVQDVGGLDLTLGQPVNFAFREREQLEGLPGIRIDRNGPRYPAN